MKNPFWVVVALVGLATTALGQGRDLAIVGQAGNINLAGVEVANQQAPVFLGAGAGWSEGGPNLALWAGYEILPATLSPQWRSRPEGGLIRLDATLWGGRTVRDLSLGREYSGTTLEALGTATIGWRFHNKATIGGFVGLGYPIWPGLSATGPGIRGVAGLRVTLAYSRRR